MPANTASATSSKAVITLMPRYIQGQAAGRYPQYERPRGRETCGTNEPQSTAQPIDGLVTRAPKP